MKINPKTESHHREVQAEEIERVRKEIRSLPSKVQTLIQKGEDEIDESIDFEKNQHNGKEQNVNGINVFNLLENIPGDVMKYLAMLYTAGGYHNVRIDCDCFDSFNSDGSSLHRVKYPNQISFTLEQGRRKG